MVTKKINGVFCDRFSIHPIIIRHCRFSVSGSAPRNPRGGKSRHRSRSSEVADHQQTVSSVGGGNTPSKLLTSVDGSSSFEDQVLELPGGRASF